MTTTRNVARALLAFLLLVLALGSCSTGAGTTSNEPPSARLVTAKQHFDAARYIRFTLTAQHLPTRLKGLVSAAGTGTHAPAFTGTVRVQSGVQISAPVIAVHNRLYAKLPFAGWSLISPAHYGAPDPATLLSKSGGLSSLFTATTKLATGASERQGSTIVTTIDGVLPASAVRRVFPSAGNGNFSVSYRLDDNNTIVGATITGPFYAGFSDVTYTLTVDLHAHAVVISAPV